ncbi:hypothetical protein M885DRAFT_504787 [Pelagophyceae sp. CCMP2097]|nr:hypothetical protein M885DRAFT_504787 [Pelagophyceae sp. CCMP2097]
MDAAWNDSGASPYDVLGVDDDASDAAVKTAYRELARLFHPDRNHAAADAELRTAHFVKVKKAYETLSDSAARKLYDSCLLNREKLVRKNQFKYAVAHAPEFRDVVDEQFKDAVLDPDSEIAGDAIVLCCESCGAPSSFRCSICDMLVCRFCSLKQHAKDNIPPHYPAKYSPRFRRELESEGRKQRLLRHQADDARPWARGGAFRAAERRLFKRVSRRAADGAQAGDTAKLARCYGWCQTAGAVYVAVWVPEDDFSDVSIDLHHAGRRPSLCVSPRAEAGAAVLDRELAYDVDLAHDLECVSFAATNVVAIKAVKSNYGEAWASLFAGDSVRARDAGDHDAHDWKWDEAYAWDDLDAGVIIDVHVPRGCTKRHLNVIVTARKVQVLVLDQPRADDSTDDTCDDDAGVCWFRHFVYDCRAAESSWCLEDVDGRRVVRLSLSFANLPRKTADQKCGSVVVIDKASVVSLFHEDADELFTLATAQLVAFLDHGPRFVAEADLRCDAAALLRALRRDRPRQRRSEPLLPKFSDAESRAEDRHAQRIGAEFVPGEPVRQWYARAAITRDDDWAASQGPADDAHASRPIEVDGPPPPADGETRGLAAADAPASEAPRDGPVAITTFAWDGNRPRRRKRSRTNGHLWRTDARFWRRHRRV